MRLRTYHASCLDYHTGSLMCMSTYKHTHTITKHTHKHRHTHTQNKKTHTQTQTHTHKHKHKHTHRQTQTHSFFHRSPVPPTALLSSSTQPGGSSKSPHPRYRILEITSRVTLPAKKDRPPPPPPPSLSLSLCLSFFLSAGHRGRRNDPQALGPPDHSLCY